MPKKTDVGSSGPDVSRSKTSGGGPKVLGGAAAKAEKRAVKRNKIRVELALKMADRANMVYDATSRQRAKSWMTRMVAGCDFDVRSNLFRRGREHIPYVDVIAGFDEIYSSVMSGVDADLVALINEQLEAGNREKIGPKSKYLGYYEDGPEKLAAVLSNKSIPEQLEPRALHRAIDHLVAEIPSQSIRLYDVDTVVSTLRVPGMEHDPESPGLDGTTNSGLPFCRSGWMVQPGMSVAEARECKVVQDYITRRSKELYTKLSRGVVVTFMAMVGQRTVSRGLDPLSDAKTKRLILAMDKAEAVLWKMFTPQLQNRRRELRAPGGVQIHCAWCDSPAVDESMQTALSVAAEHGRKVLSGDVSGFDASVVPEIWELMAYGMSDWFYKAKKFFAALNISDIRGVRVLSPTGVTEPTASSIKSGSGGTNFVDSMYNLLAMYYGEERGYYKLVNYAVQGDDFIVDGEGLEPEAIAEAYQHLGLSVHPDKQTYVSKALTYLQRLHFHGMPGGMASAYRTLGSTLVYEKLLYKANEWNPYMEAIQAISKLENAGFHPAFEALVGYVKDSDKYSLGADVHASQVIELAGGRAGDLLSAQSRFTLNAGVLDRTTGGFDRAVTNGVLRGELLPPIGSRERFLRVYGNERIAKATGTTA